MLSRAKWCLRKQLPDERRAFVQTAARRLATFAPTSIGRRQRQLPGSSFPGLVFACQSVASSLQAFAKGAQT